MDKAGRRGVLNCCNLLGRQVTWDLLLLPQALAVFPAPETAEGGEQAGSRHSLGMSAYEVAWRLGLWLAAAGIMAARSRGVLTCNAPVAPAPAWEAWGCCPAPASITARLRAEEGRATEASRGAGD
jgi:hypothetical protein